MLFLSNECLVLVHWGRQQLPHQAVLPYCKQGALYQTTAIYDFHLLLEKPKSYIIVNYFTKPKINFYHRHYITWQWRTTRCTCIWLSNTLNKKYVSDQTLLLTCYLVSASVRLRWSFWYICTLYVFTTSARAIRKASTLRLVQCSAIKLSRCSLAMPL